MFRAVAHVLDSRDPDHWACGRPSTSADCPDDETTHDWCTLCLGYWRTEVLPSPLGTGTAVRPA